ncbi:MAG: methyltransferase domain-containing protein, partial [Methyloceanibacter sp.]
IYVTSSSLGLVDHFRKYAEHVVDRFKWQPGSLAVEIGSNDGSLLRFFKGKGMRVLGVDPARQIAQDATEAGIPTLPEFFNSDIAASIRKEHGPASVVAANNVFAHADNLADIVRGIRTVLADDGIFVFEVSYLVDIVDKFLFDTVYHEHVSYHSIAPLAKFFSRLGMELFDTQRIASKGGSIRGFAQRKPEGKRRVEPIVGELLDLEAKRGFGKPDLFRKYDAEIGARKTDLDRFLDQIIAEGKLIAGYGASTTTTTLMWHFDLTRRLAFIVDDNPRKRGLYSPGCHIPVMPSEEIYVKQPDHVVILAWQYAEPIIKKHQAYLKSGGRFVVPLPDLRIVEASGE